MSNHIFRQKSMERISSPEQLNDYIRVSNPGVWLVLAAVIVLLAGTCVWGVFGRLETTVKGAAVVKGGVMTVYIKEEHLGTVEAGMPMRVKDKEYTIDQMERTPVSIPEGFDEYVLHVGGLQVGEWVFTVTSMNTDFPEGVYGADIVVESITPMSFIFN